jgi:hypothetical protein
MKVAELFAELGINITSDGLQKASQFKNELVSMAGKATLVVAAITAAGFAIKKFSENAAQAANALRLFNQATGLSIEQLQRWQAAAQISEIGLSAEQVTSSVQGLQLQLAQIRLGQGNLRPFQLLGIDVQGADAFDVLDQLRVKIRQLDPGLATNILQELGLGPEFISVLRLSREEFDKLGNRYIRSADQIRSLVKLGKAFKEFGLEMKSATDKFIAFATPAIIEFLKVLKNNLDFVVGITKELFLGVENLNQILPGFTLLLAGVTAGLFAMLVPFGPIIIAIGALLLLIDDFMAFNRGAGSMIGTALNAFDRFTSSIEKWINDRLITPIESFIEKTTGLKVTLDKVAKVPGVGLKVLTTSPLLSLFKILKMLNQISEEKGKLGDPTATTSALSSSPVTFNNTFNVTGENAQETANAITKTQQEQFNFALADLNNGAAT